MNDFWSSHGHYDHSPAIYFGCCRMQESTTIVGIWLYSVVKVTLKSWDTPPTKLTRSIMSEVARRPGTFSGTGTNYYQPERSCFILTSILGSWEISYIGIAVRLVTSFAWSPRAERERTRPATERPNRKRTKLSLDQRGKVWSNERQGRCRVGRVRTHERTRTK
jgi:hypothetical protein